MEDGNGNRRSRTSILKPQRSRNPLSEVEISELRAECTPGAKATKRVNFKRISLVKPFILDSDERTTIWDSTYEEEVPHTDSSHSPGKGSDSTSPENPGGQDDLNITKFIIDEEQDMQEIAGEEIHKNRTVFLDETVEFTQAVYSYNVNRTNRTILMDASMNLTTLPFIDKENITVGKDFKNKPSILSFARRSTSIDSRVNRSNVSIIPNTATDFVDSDSRMELTTNIPATITSSGGINKSYSGNRDGLDVSRRTIHKVSDEFVPEAMGISYRESAQTPSTKCIMTENNLNMVPRLRKEMFDLSRSNSSGKENINLAEFPASNEDNESSRNNLGINTNKTVCFTELDDGMEFTKNIPVTFLTPFIANELSKNDDKNTNNTIRFDESDDGMELTKNIPAAVLTSVFADKSNKHDDKNTNETIRFDDSDDGMELTKNIPAAMLTSVFADDTNENDDKNTNKTIRFGELDDGMEFTSNIPTKMVVSEHANKFNRSRIIRDWNSSRNMPLKTLEDTEISSHYASSTSLKEPTVSSNNHVSIHFEQTVSEEAENTQISASKNFDDETTDNTTVLNDISMDLTTLTSADKETIEDGMKNTSIIVECAKNKDNIDFNSEINSNESDNSMELTTNIPAMIAAPANSCGLDNGEKNCDSKMSENVPLNVSDKTASDDMEISYCGVPQMPSEQNTENISCPVQNNDLAKIICLKENCEDIVISNALNKSNMVKSCSSKENIELSCSFEKLSAVLPITQPSSEDKIDTNRPVPNEQRLLFRHSNAEKKKKGNNVCDIDSDEDTSFFLGFAFDYLQKKPVPALNMDTTKVNISSNPLFRSLRSMSPCVDSTQQLINYKLGTQSIEIPRISDVLEPKMPHYDDTRSESLHESVMLASTSSKRNESISQNIEIPQFSGALEPKMTHCDDTRSESLRESVMLASTTNKRIESISQNIEMPRISDILESKMPHYDDTGSESLCESVMLASTSNKRDESLSEVVSINSSQENSLGILESTNLELSLLAKSDISEDNPSIGKSRSDIASDYKAAMDKLRHVIENVKIEKVEFAHKKLDDNDFFNIDFDATYNMIKQKVESFSLMLKPPERPTLQEYYESLKMNELSERSLEAEEDKKNKENENSNADINIEIPPKVATLLEKIQETEQRCAPYWKFDGEEDDKYHFSTLYGKLKLVLQFNSEGVVYDIQMIDILSADSPPISHYVMRLFKEALDSRQLEATLGFRYTILSFLDYLYMVMQNMLDFMCELDDLKMKMDPVNIITLRILNVDLILNWVVKIDVTDLKNMSPDHVSVEVRTYSLRKPTVSHEDAIKNLVNECPKGLSFLKCFREKIDGYIQCIAKRRKFTEKK